MSRYVVEIPGPFEQKKLVGPESQLARHRILVGVGLLATLVAHGHRRHGPDHGEGRDNKHFWSCRQEVDSYQPGTKNGRIEREKIILFTLQLELRQVETERSFLHPKIQITLFMAIVSKVLFVRVGEKKSGEKPIHSIFLALCKASCTLANLVPYGKLAK